jgi:diguanylate cyclase (GGDEF)-like protein
MPANGFTEAKRERKRAHGNTGGKSLGRLRRFLGRQRSLSFQDDAKVDPEAERREFGERLELELERAQRTGRHLSLVIGELPSDLHVDPGAMRFDEDVLRIALGVIAGQKRRIDVSARVGDARFALVLPETDEQGALVLTERLRKAIANAIGDLPAVRFGIATFPRHGRTIGALVHAADRALRAAFTLGREGLVETANTAANAAATMVSGGGGSELGDPSLEPILALAETVDVRARGDAGHAETVGRYAERIARELGFSVTAADRVRLAGFLRDVGKIGVPEAVLKKPGPLDRDEWELVKQHSELGARLIDDPELDDVKKWVLAHHERPDGQGYPRGLRAEAIPVEARILAVAEAYEAMTTDRPHRGALTHERAQAELVAFASTQFDRRVVEAFMRTLEREGLRARTPIVATR